jgi:hypothetical protein
MTATVGSRARITANTGVPIQGRCAARKREGERGRCEAIAECRLVGRSAPARAEIVRSSASCLVPVVSCMSRESECLAWPSLATSDSEQGGERTHLAPGGSAMGTYRQEMRRSRRAGERARDAQTRHRRMRAAVPADPGALDVCRRRRRARVRRSPGAVHRSRTAAAGAARGRAGRVGACPTATAITRPITVPARGPCVSQFPPGTVFSPGAQKRARAPAGRRARPAPPTDERARVLLARPRAGGIAPPIRPGVPAPAARAALGEDGRAAGAPAAGAARRAFARAAVRAAAAVVRVDVRAQHAPDPGRVPAHTPARARARAGPPGRNSGGAPRARAAGGQGRRAHARAVRGRRTRRAGLDRPALVRAQPVRAPRSRAGPPARRHALLRARELVPEGG